MERSPIETIIRVFHERGHGKYGDECVTQVEHAIQSALLAASSEASVSRVVAALLHDLGHILHDSEMPDNNDQDLNDFHEEKAYAWLLRYFGQKIADPVRLHVAAKRYLCTTDPHYADLLSPTSLKSFHDQGGTMSSVELQQFESEPYFRQSLELRRWDDLAKEQDKEIPKIEYFVPLLETCLVQA